MQRIGFIIEQALGHITHGQNLQRFVSEDADVQAAWGLPTWDSSGWESRLPGIRSNWTLRAGLQARRFLKSMQRERRLEALFIHTQVPAVLAQDWMRRIPTIVSLDATPQQYDSLGDFYQHQAGPDWLEKLKWRLNRDCFQKARHLVTWSEWAKEGLVEEYQVPPEKVTVIPPGVDVSAWKPTTAGQENDAREHVRGAREAVRGAPALVRILFVGGDLQRKGGLLLLEAFRSLQQRLAAAGGPAVELHLVTRDQLDAEPGVFVHHGMQPNSAELKQLYFQSDIFALPTLGDCLPMVLSEAGAAGLPALTTRVAAIPEIVAHEKTGLLVPPGEAAPLVDGLWRLVTSQGMRQEMGEAAVRRVAQSFDARANAQRLLEMLKQLAAENRAEQPGK
jgi:glycosyltransferase involved in cell wall biosynthesis